MEARTEALKVQHPLRELQHHEGRQAPQIFTNPDADTVWIAHTNLWSTNKVLEICAEISINSDPKIATIAFDLQYWQDRENSEEWESFYYMMDDLEDFGTKELILSVGDRQPRHFTDVVFIEPRFRPSESLSAAWWDKFRNSRTSERSKLTFDESLSWKVLEEEAMQFVRDFQADRAGKTKEFLDRMYKSYSPKDKSSQELLPPQLLSPRT
jgi:hypothetical protein